MIGLENSYQRYFEQKLKHIKIIRNIMLFACFIYGKIRLDDYLVVL